MISERLNNDLMDIEELVNFGTKHECCPFYGARQVRDPRTLILYPAAIVLYPYNP